MIETIIHCSSDKLTWLSSCGRFETGNHGFLYFPDATRITSDGMSGKNIVYTYNKQRHKVDDEMFSKISENQAYSDYSKKADILNIYLCTSCLYKLPSLTLKE